MKKVKKTFSIDELKKINLKATENYIAKLDENQKAVDFKRFKAIDKEILNFVKDSNCDIDIINEFIDKISSPIKSDDEKKALYYYMIDFLKENPLLVIQLKDNNSILQKAVFVWYIKSDDDSLDIKAVDEKGNFQYSYKRYIFINENLDKSFGVQAENPRLKISSVINSILNYQFFKSCAGYGKLLTQNPIFINDIIDDITISDDIIKFGGQYIINRGFYDSPDDFASDKAKSSKSSISSGDDYESCDIFNIDDSTDE